MKHVKVIVITASPLVEAGLVSLLAKENVTVSSAQDASTALRRLDGATRALVVAETQLLDRAETEALRRKALLVGLSAVTQPPETAGRFDEVLSLYVTPGKLISLIEAVRHSGESNSGGTHNKDSRELTPREREVVVGIVKGLSNKEIASEINVSVNTVMTHRRNITAKLQIHSAAGLTIYAIMKKMVTIEDIHEHII